MTLQDIFNLAVALMSTLSVLASLALGDSSDLPRPVHLELGPVMEDAFNVTIEPTILFKKLPKGWSLETPVKIIKEEY